MELNMGYAYLHTRMVSGYVNILLIGKDTMQDISGIQSNLLTVF